MDSSHNYDYAPIATLFNTLEQLQLSLPLVLRDTTQLMSLQPFSLCRRQSE